MANIFDYLKWRGDLTFIQDPPNAVDALVFSSLSYIQFHGMVEALPQVPVSLKEAAEDFFSQEDYEACCRIPKDLNLLHGAIQTKRYGSCQICMYRDLFVPEQETQFAAMTFLLDDGSMFLERGF